MRVTSQDVIAFLRSGSIYNSLTKEKRDRYLDLYERATKVTSHLTGLPSGGNTDHEAVLANLADAATGTEKWWGLLQKRRELIREFLEECSLTEFHREILINRYIYNLGWEPMKYSLRRYDKPTVASLRTNHDQALKLCAEWVNNTNKYKKEILDI